ncbi:hypothetical protein PMAYCL1PPCAC_08487, partial [Pristionchus mayeri]
CNAEQEIDDDAAITTCSSEHANEQSEIEEDEKATPHLCYAEQENVHNTTKKPSRPISVDLPTIYANAGSSSMYLSQPELATKSSPIARFLRRISAVKDDVQSGIKHVRSSLSRSSLRLRSRPTRSGTRKYKGYI